MANVAEILKSKTKELTDASIVSATLDVCAIMSFYTGLSRLDLFTETKKELTETESQNIDSAIKRRALDEPLAYILGEKEFWGLTFKVEQGILIPRPDTETLIATLLAALPNKDEAFNFADLGTGSGAILVSILHEYQNATGTAVDINPQALAIAKSNAELNEVSDRARFVKSSWLADVNDCFNIIVSNPPYITPAVIDTLEASVKDFEPDLALNGGEDGLDCYRVIIREACEKLEDGGLLLLEIGYDQNASVTELLKNAEGWGNISSFKDFAGNDRVVAAVKLDVSKNTSSEQ